ncbi:hypothetical protein AAG570_010498 [Ranatra chinensis]|uniref:CRAL-TRIO domain-containing protein n=1 Tax=Ranatra chinensis TaxID=642074 RepID=A0ABD0YMQ3_9HEMI
MRRSVADCCTMPYHDDYYLLRWLRARNFDPMAADKMLRASLKWREEWDVGSLENWSPPEVFEKYYPSGVCGYDKEGSPIIVVPFAGLDVWGMLHSVNKTDIIKRTIKELETHLANARKQAKEHGPAANQLVAIMDMTDFNIRQYAWRPAAELVISMLQMYEANYPEILKICYIINVPKVFALAFSIVKNFLNEYTLSKIRIYKNDPNKWQPELLRQIDTSQLPVYLGGSMRDPDGNPVCPSKIRQGGKVPKSFYTKKVEKLVEGKEDYVSVTVKKGDKLSLDFIVPEKGSFLKWGFYTDSHDIKFGVLSKNSDGNENEVVPIHRVPSHQAEEMGVITCPEPATCK